MVAVIQLKRLTILVQNDMLPGHGGKGQDVLDLRVDRRAGESGIGLKVLLVFFPTAARLVTLVWAGWKPAYQAY
jgi:hypothetical protein